MIEMLKSEIALHGDKAAVVPIHHLQNIRKDLQELEDSEKLNNFQHYILNNLYQLDVPVSEFTSQSIIIVASPGPSTIEIIFNWKGHRIQSILPASYVEKETAPLRIENYLKAFLNPQGYHLLYAPQLPRKRIAVSSGLGLYGRNNICYVEGMGSFINLSLFFCDIPCIEDSWQDIRQMDICQTCRKCLENCPTSAITPVKFLIDNERCLTYFNEAGGEWDFPTWIDPSSHHTLYGCMRCQTVCPANRPVLNNVQFAEEFSEEETRFLMQGKPFDLFPKDLKQKVVELNMMNYLGVLPRNLGVLFEGIA
jgi:epoxyqueuosine reductase